MLAGRIAGDTLASKEKNGNGPRDSDISSHFGLILGRMCSAVPLLSTPRPAVFLTVELLASELAERHDTANTHIVVGVVVAKVTLPQHSHIGTEDDNFVCFETTFTALGSGAGPGSTC